MGWPGVKEIRTREMVLGAPPSAGANCAAPLCVALSQTTPALGYCDLVDRIARAGQRRGMKVAADFLHQRTLTSAHSQHGMIGWLLAWVPSGAYVAWRPSARGECAWKGNTADASPLQVVYTHFLSTSSHFPFRFSVILCP